QRFVRQMALYESGQVSGVGLQVGPPGLPELAPHQIHRLNVICAFVERKNLGVTAILLDWIIARVAGASKRLDRRLANAKSLIRAIGLAQWHQQIDLTPVIRGLGLVDFAEV